METEFQVVIFILTTAPELWRGHPYMITDDATNTNTSTTYAALPKEFKKILYSTTE